MSEPISLFVELVTGGKDTELDLAYGIRRMVQLTSVPPEAAVRVLTYTIERYQREACQNSIGSSGFAGQGLLAGAQLQRGLR